MATPRVSQRAQDVPAFEVMDIVAAARRRDEELAGGAGPGSPAAGGALPTCHLEVGQPSARSPRVVLDAARAALEGPLGYSDALGTAVLRRRIAGLYLGRHGLELPPARIAVTGGASAGVVLALLSLADVGERVVVCEPGYPCYGNVARSLGLEVTAVGLDAATGYRPTAALLDGALGALDPAAVIVASPSNPTGTALDEGELAALHDWCSGRGATLVVDEIYHGTAATTLPTAAAHPDVVVLQSFSKYFCMTGWRLGWLVLPEPLVRPVERLAQNLYLSPHALSQAAAVAAFDAQDELDAHALAYRANAATLLDALRGAGVEDIAPPQGAFYVWADMSAWGDSTTLCRRWLEEIGVAATPGIDFDSRRGDRFVRFSVAGGTAEVADAAHRLAGWLGTHPGAQR